ncbi:SseB family protein [Paracoccaceae bacterium GXU_MW_L88]
MTETEIDRAYQAMQSGGDAARLAYFGRLFETELFLLLAEEPRDDMVSPAIFDVNGAGYALIFDLEERLADFANSAAPYLAMSGRTAVKALAGQGLGLGVNLGAPSETLWDAEAVAWMTEMAELATAEEARGAIETLDRPDTLPDGFLTTLDRKLANMAGLAKAAYLAKVRYKEGGEGHLLALTGVPDGAKAAVAQNIGEAVRYDGGEALQLDLVFPDLSDPLLAALERAALRIALPEPQVPQERPAPGSDPDKPPKLR